MSHGAKSIYVDMDIERVSVIEMHTHIHEDIHTERES